MTFTATAIIQSVEKLNDKFFKVLLQDERKNHILVNVPVDKEPELILNTKVSVWGNVSAFHYQSKWYNNLFAQTVVSENKKYVLLKRIENDKDNPTQFEILEFNSEFFTKDFISKRYNVEVTGEAAKIKTNLSDTLRKLLENKEENKQEANTTTSDKTLYVNAEYSHIQNSISKNLISIENNILTILKDAAFFIRNQNQSELIVFTKADSAFNFADLL